MWYFIFVLGVYIRNNVNFWTMGTQRRKKLASNTKRYKHLKKTRTKVTKQRMSTFNTKSGLWSIAGFWLGSCRPWTLIPALTFLHTLSFSSVCARTRLRALQSECTLHFGKLNNYSPLHPPLCFYLFFLPLLRIRATFLQCITFF